MYLPRLSKRLLLAALSTLPLLGGCQHMSNTDRGAAAGLGIGTAAGAAIGHASGNTGLGAVLGAVTGTVIGASAGAAADEREHRQAVRQDHAARGGYLTLEKIAEMTHSNVADAVIIDQMRLTGSVYQLTPDEIVWLKREGVSNGVINYMQSMGTHPRRIVVVEEPPPPSVGVGVIYSRRRW